MARAIAFLYDSYADAEATVRDLEAAGIRPADIGFVGTREGQHSAAAEKDARAATALGAGATIGTVVGGGAGLLAGLGLLTLPGLGPVVAAGWFAATAVGAATGAAAGAATGGLLDAMTAAGIREEYAHVYAEGVRRGSTLVSVRAPDGELNRVEAIMRRHDPVDTTQRALAFRNSGWTGFDEEAGPYVRPDTGEAGTAPRKPRRKSAG